MFSQIQELQQTGGTTSYGSREDAKLGRDDFLKIFLTQLQYQDPLNPMEGTEFTAQLAQFSSLEQLFNINDQLKGLEQIQGKEGKIQALNLIDKVIRAEGSQLYLKEGRPAQGAFDLKDGAECLVVVQDSSGNQVRTIPLGILSPGLHDFTWDGKNEQGLEMAEGVYQFKVMARDSSGNLVEASSMISGKVTGVSIKDEVPVIFVDKIPIRLDQIIDITTGQSTTEDDQVLNSDEGGGEKGV